MATAIKVSESLAEEARAAAVDADRSLTGQVEHWARLGKAVEPLFSSTTIAALKKCGGDLSAVEEEGARKSVIDTLNKLRHSPAYSQTASFLRETAGPLYEVDPGDPTAIVRVAGDGVREPGEFKRRVFLPKEKRS